MDIEPSTENHPPARAGRLFFFDHLRAACILLVIILHTSITYMTSPPPWWYVIEPENSRLFTALVLLLDVPPMQILFFIAGLFAYPSLERYGTRRFLRQKVVRLGLPWLFGVVFLAPLVVYLATVTRGISKSYVAFWMTDFWGPYYQQSVYWFLGILLLLFALLAMLWNSDASLQHIPRQPQLPSWRLFARFLVITTLWYFFFSLWNGQDYWMNDLKLLVFQPSRLLLYGAYFILGIIADRRGWFLENGYRPQAGVWSFGTILTAGLYLGLRLTETGKVDPLALAAQAVLFNAFCLSALLASSALFQRFVNRPTRLRSSLGRNAYAIYYLHPLILYPAAFFGLSIQAPILVEAAFLVVFTVGIAWSLGARVLTRWRVLREIF